MDTDMVFVFCLVTDYVEEIFQTFMNASKEEMLHAATKLREKTPVAMNSMMEKQPREEALKKRADRKRMVVKDVPPTTPGTSQLPFFIILKNDSLFEHTKTSLPCYCCAVISKGHLKLPLSFVPSVYKVIENTKFTVVVAIMLDHFCMTLKNGFTKCW